MTTRPRNFRAESLFSLNIPELPRTLRNSAEKRCIEMSLFLYGNSPEMRETEGKFCGQKFKHGNEFIFVWKFCGNEGNFCGKNLGMEMSLFLYGNSVEMRETEGNSAGKNKGMEMSLLLYGILRK